MMIPLFSRRTLALMTTALFVTVGAASAFTTPATSRTAFRIGTRQRQADFPTTTTTTTTTTTRLNLIPLPPHDVIQSTSQWLADATAAATAASTDSAAVPSLGWWGQYINLFKVSLEFVHGAIEQPLKSIGIEQTWGPAIGLFTMSIRALLIPISIQQNQSAEYMKALKPYIKEINEKFKDNDDAKNRAVGRLYQDANQNPLAGCLTSLAQLPIFLGLYRGVRELAMANELNEPFLWIPSLEGPTRPPDFRDLDWLTSGWHTTPGSSLPEPLMGWETTLAFLIMPVILVVLQSMTMQILQPPVEESSNAEEKKQLETTQTVLKFLPLMIGFFSLQVPAGLTIYWFTTNIFTLTQSLAVRAYFAANPPNINLPDYWDSVVSGNVDDLTPEGRRAAASAGLRVGPSLEDLQVEARFHVLVERGNVSLRETSPAWQRVGSRDLPHELATWVAAAPLQALTKEAWKGNANGAAAGMAVPEEDQHHHPASETTAATTTTTAESSDASAPYYVK